MEIILKKRMDKNIAKKIFTKDQAIQFLEKIKPELFGFKTKRCRVKKYLGEDVYDDIQDIKIQTIKDYTREYSITKGKYSDIHSNPEYTKLLINKSKINKSESPCHPENFSESVVKPIMRDFIRKDFKKTTKTKDTSKEYAGKSNSELIALLNLADKKAEFQAERIQKLEAKCKSAGIELGCEYKEPEYEIYAINPLNQENSDELNIYIQDNLLEPLIKHSKERLNQQLKADYSEYIILMNCDNIIPTLKHSKGTDMYFIKEDGKLEDLDIKTTRSIWGINDKKDAIKNLYEKQGKDSFSDNTRMYIYLSDEEICDQEKIIKQMDEKYDIEFIYEKKKYQVNGCRLIIV